MRSLTAVESALVFAIGGSLLAVMVPSFIRNLHASRMAEPLNGLQQIAARATELADASSQESAYPESAPLTPAAVPRGEPVTDPPGTWDHPTWRLLGFSLNVPHSYSFEFVSSNGKAESSFSAIARGDLDGDGVQSTFELRGSMKRSEQPIVHPLEVIREVE